MSAQRSVRNGIDPDGIKAKPLFAAFQRIAADFHAHNRIVSEIRFLPPESVPAGMKKQELRCIRRLPYRFNALHTDGLPCLQVMAVDHKGFSHKLRRRHLIQLCSLSKQMKRRVHVGSRMGGHGKQRFPKAILFVGVYDFQPRRRCAGIYRHIIGNRLRQIDHFHAISSSFLRSASICPAVILIK